MTAIINKETFRTEYVENEVPSVPVKTSTQRKDALKIAEAVREWLNENNGTFTGMANSAYAVHASQIWTPETSKLTDKPYNFFVVDKQLTTVEWAKKIQEEDRALRDITNIVFPEQIIFNPEIITATQTFMDDVKRKDGSYRKKAVANVMTFPEACMSYNHHNRKPRNITRFYRITVRYQIAEKVSDKLVTLKTIEENVQGLKAHIFQHEIDHANGLNTIYSKLPEVSEREIENGVTRKEMEEYTAKILTELEEKIQNNGVCLLQSIANGGLYKAPTTLKELPDGFIEPDMIDLYDLKTGHIKSPFDSAPEYTAETAQMSEEELEKLEITLDNQV